MRDINDTIIVAGVAHRVISNETRLACELYAVHEQLARAAIENGVLRQRVSELEAEKSRDRMNELRKEHGLPQSFSWQRVDDDWTLIDKSPQPPKSA